MIDNGPPHKCGPSLGIHSIYGKHVNMDPMVITICFQNCTHSSTIFIFSCPKCMAPICTTCVPYILVNQPFSPYL